MAHSNFTIATMIVMDSEGFSYRQISDHCLGRVTASSTVSDILKRNRKSSEPLSVKNARKILQTSGGEQRDSLQAYIGEGDTVTSLTRQVPDTPSLILREENVKLPEEPLKWTNSRYGSGYAINNDVIVIADTQVSEESKLDHMYALAKYIWDNKPGYIVHIGDHFDLPSLSSYASALESEGRRLYNDLEAGFHAFKIIMDYSKEMSRKTGIDYEPVKHFLMGNHEDRLRRFVATHPVLEGCFDLHKFVRDQGWQVHEMNEPLWINDVAYCHYFENPQSGRPVGGSIENRLNKFPHSFVQGHQQMYLYGSRQNLMGKPHFGVVSGSFYITDEGYRGANNTEQRGFVHMKSFTNRYDYLDYDVEHVSLERLLNIYKD